MVIAAGSVMNDPNNGPIVRMVNHQAVGVQLPSLATRRIAASAKAMIGDLVKEFTGEGAKLH